MGEAFFRRGENPQAVEHFQQGLAYLGYHLPMTSGEIRQGLMREMVRQVAHRLLPRLFIKPTAELGSPAVVEEVWIDHYMGYIDALANPERFLMISSRLLNLGEERGDPLGIVFGCYLLGVALHFLGLYRLGGWYLNYGLNIAIKLQLPWALGTAHFGLQIEGLYRGEFNQSLEHGRQSLHAHNKTGDIVGRGGATTYLAWILAHRGDMSASLVHSRELIRLAQDAEARAQWCTGAAALGYALRRQGQLQEAVQHQQKAIELAEEIPDHNYRILAGAELGLCYLRQGDYNKALSELKTCQQVTVEHQLTEPYSQVTTLTTTAEACLFAVEHGPSSERETWLNKAKGACRIALKQAPKLQPKLSKAMRLRGTYEWLRGKPAAAQKWWQKSLVEAERIGLKYDIGMIHLEMGKRLDDRVHLEKAEEIFAEIGAELDLAKARELLQR